MENIAFIDIFTTQNDLYGHNNCPIQFTCEIFKNEEVFSDEIFLKNIPQRMKSFNIIPDEPILPIGTVISGFRDSDIHSDTFNGKGLREALETIYALLSTLKEKRMFIGGYNHVSYDLKILNDTFKRVLNREPIEFPKERVVDVFKICENTLDVREIGSYSTDSVFEYLFHDLETLKRIRNEKGTRVDIHLTKMILRKLMKNGESFSELLSRTAPRDDLDIFTFGKYKGAKIEDVFKVDQQYVNWVLKNKTFQEQSPNVIRSVNRIISKNVNITSV